MQKDVNQAAYDTFYRVVENLNVATVYPINPPGGVPYPFIQMGNLQVVPIETKSWLLANLYVNIDVWGDWSDRGLVSGIAEKIRFAMYGIRSIESGHRVSINANACSVEVLPDRTSNTDLWRARISLEYKLS